ncbi:MAG TPA: HRDC domain-containing protein, partial [Tepidisphaeraceae bacterium]|nr:HRDC domain-containing protein [Tepidisphaeraceae bacterium]
QTHQCRRQMILNYFGEERTVEDCACDVCRRSQATSATSQKRGEVISDEVVLVVRQMLSAIARLNGRFGLSTVADVLAGNDNERLRRWDLQNLSVYGLLKARSGKQVIAMLHRLMEAGLARQRDPDGIKFRPVVEITAAGVAVMKGDQLPPPVLEDLLPRRRIVAEPGAMASGYSSAKVSEPVVELDADALARFERLRQTRHRLASERQLPPYCICHDSTLKLIAANVPADESALAQIKGMGPARIQQYGRAILDALHNTL